MQERIVNIFFAYTSDSQDLLQIAKQELEVLNRTNSIFHFNFLEWKHNTVSEMGNPEKTILKQMPVDASNFFIGLFRFKYGTPTGNKNPDTGMPYKSGMEEEFFTAYRLWKKYGRPQIVIFRSMEAIPRRYSSESNEDMDSFFKEFSPTGEHPGLYKEFESKEQFGEFFRQSIMTYILKELNSNVVPKGGVKNIFFEGYNSQRNEAKQKEILSTSFLKLQARTGFSYLMPKTVHSPMIISGLDRGMKVQIVIQNPWSVNSVLTLLRRGDFLREKDYNDYLKGVLSADKLLEVYRNSHWINVRMRACIQSYQSLRKQYKNLIELRLSSRDLSNSILLTDNFLFWEPYFGIVEYDKKNLSVFEIQINNTNPLYSESIKYFDRLWKTSILFNYFEKNQRLLENNLSQFLNCNK